MTTYHMLANWLESSVTVDVTDKLSFTVIFFKIQMV